MKTLGTLLLIGSLGLLAGCSTTQVAEPSSTASAGTSTSAHTLGAVPGDVIASKIHVRSAISIARDTVQVSTALAPTDLIGGGVPEVTSTTDFMRVVPAGQSGVVRVPIDTTDGDAYIFLSPQVQGNDAIQAALHDIIVTDPNGQRVNLREPKGGNAPVIEMSAIPLNGLPTGVYTVSFNGGSPKVGVAIEARLNASKIVMKLVPSTLQHLLGNAISVDATLLDDGKPITGANVTADLFSGEAGRQHVAPLVFQEVGNGVYRATVDSKFDGSSPIGAYLTEVRAEGKTSSGTEFARHGQTGFHFGIPTARIAGLGAHRTITGADGKIAAFEVDVNVESASYDRLEISARLAATGSGVDEHPFAIAHVGQGFDPGMHMVTLRFDAGQARLTGMEGDFYLRDLQMYSLGTNTLFHRETAADNRVFPAVSRASLTRLVQLNPAQQQLVVAGTFRAD